MEIERQQELGTEGLLEEDSYLAECNMVDLEDTSGMKETYWLLAIRAAREAGRLESMTSDSGHSTEPTIERAHFKTTVVWLHGHTYPV